MGTGVAMRYPFTRLATAALVALALAACSNDSARIDIRALVQNAAPQLAASLGAGATDPAAAPLTSPAAVLAATTTPVAFARTEQDKAFYVLGVRDNGPYRTFATTTRQTLVLRQGLVTATRGLGQDLMASKADTTLAMLAAGREGRARRVMQVLDGEDVTRDLVLDCVLTQGAADLPRPVAALPVGRRMTETCKGLGYDGRAISFANSYLVDAAGRIVLSRQWLPTQSGTLSLQILRD